ncbi:MAG: hypothetical protein MI723_12415, partial [Caulobacterales bacterium]|nr:hypothetical protein [Caulobacterales bacterium]
MAADHHRDITLGAIAAALAVEDEEFTLAPRNDEERLRRLVAAYRDRNASFFRRDWGGWLSHPAEDAFAPAPPERCARIGGVAELTPLGGGAYRVSAAVTGAAPTWVAVVDAAGVIAGLARRGQRFRTAPHPQLDGARHAGYARLSDPGAAAFLAVRRDGVCPLRTAIAPEPGQRS